MALFYISVPFISCCRVDRLHYLTYLQQRWHGPMSLAIFSTPAELSTVQKTLRSLHHRKEVVRVVLYIANEKAYYFHGSLGYERRESTSKLYPINLLRDLAILNVVTTHYVNLDMDLWPSSTLREHFSMLPIHILGNSKSAIILPAFQFSPSIRKEYGQVTSVNAAYVFILSHLAPLIRLDWRRKFQRQRRFFFSTMN